MWMYIYVYDEHNSIFVFLDSGKSNVSVVWLLFDSNNGLSNYLLVMLVSLRTLLICDQFSYYMLWSSFEVHNHVETSTPEQNMVSIHKLHPAIQIHMHHSLHLYITILPASR